MSDPAIKLFGKTIVLPCATDEGGGGGGGDDSKGSPNKETTAETKQESPSLEERTEPAICGAADDREKPPSSDDQETTVPRMDSNAEKEEKGDPGNPQEKTVMKKPDKILPCPRCNSMDTKFCYYNNYNVNQPRHFCKNCQRYWTAGGTMRNVPVGAGRRKNKNYSSAYLYHHHLSMSAEAATLSDQLIHHGNHHPALNPNGTVLSFGPDTPLCESMASVLNLAEQTAKNCVRNGFSQREDQVGEERTTVSSLIVSNSNPPHPLPQVPYMNASPWPYPWNPPPSQPLPGSAFCTPTFPIPFYPAAAAYWGCSVPWSIPWPSPPLPSSPAPAPAPATTTTSGSSVSGPNSPTLGKHSRNGEVLFRNSNNSSDSDKGETGNQEKCLWIPKTLRIDDPEEASKSSFWTTLGFKNEKPDAPSSQSGLFRPFQIKDEFSSHKAEDSPALHANPAALSRSINFHESL